MVNITRRKKVERQLYTAKGELASQLRDMTYLHELGGRLATARGWRATLDEVLSAVASLQGADMAMVLIREPGGDGLALAAGLGLPEEFARLLGRSRSTRGPLGRRWPRAEPSAIEDVEAEPEVDSSVRHAARVGGFRALPASPCSPARASPSGRSPPSSGPPTGPPSARPAWSRCTPSRPPRRSRPPGSSTGSSRPTAARAGPSPASRSSPGRDPRQPRDADPAAARKAVEGQVRRLRQARHAGRSPAESRNLDRRSACPTSRPRRVDEARDRSAARLNLVNIGPRPPKSHP